MKFEGLFDPATATALRFDWLVSELEPVTDCGRRIFAEVEPFSAGEQAQEHAQRIATIAAALDAGRIDAMREVLRSTPDASGPIALASMGDALTDVNFLEMQRFCDVLARTGTLLGEYSPYTLPLCEEVSKALEPGRSGKFGFYLDDRFDKELAAARKQQRDAQAAFEDARGHLAARISQSLGREQGGTAEFIIMRDELRGAVPQGVRVTREAPTYYLCELELDEAALEALRRRDDLTARVACLEERVRARLSDVIRKKSAELQEASRVLGAIDVLLAAARFTQRYACTVARYAPDDGVTFTDAHFLPLQTELERQDRTYIPISLAFSGVAVLTGPNMGGKSIGLRTCGFIAACAAFGLPVPATRANVPLFAHIAWLGIGIAEDEEGLLSSFAREVVRLRDKLLVKRQPELLLVDEFARTTTPDEGRALLLALIARLRQQGTCALVATHLSGIAPTAGVPHFAVRGLRAMPEPPPEGDLQAALAQLAQLMDYTIELVTGDSQNAADAIFLAGLLGMDRPFIESAWQLLAGGESGKI
ncbi:MAG: hypothetical protein ABR584_03000 [Candidatus Baltobacteraceae bacterium]